MMPMRSARRSATSRMWVVRMTRAAIAQEFEEDVLDQARGGGIEAGERFVEEDKPRPMDERAGEGDLLLHAARVGFDPLMAAVPQAEALEEFLGAGTGDDLVDVPERGDEFEVLHRVEVP